MTPEERHSAARSQLRQLEISSLAEAVTLAVLVFVAVPLKHLAGWDGAVHIVGPLHGLAFCAFLWNVWQTGASGRWRRIELARLIVAAFIPLGGFLNWPWLVRQTRMGIPAV